MLWNRPPAETPPADRDAALAAALLGRFTGEPRRGPLPGGRTAALAALAGYDLGDYGKSRNFVAGAVSRLSPYLRHGMLSVTEVRDAIRERCQTEPHRAEEFLKQFAWRDFFDKVLAWHGRRLDDDLEAPKHAVPRSDDMPADVASATTGLPCMDGMLTQLFDAGYLHNHQRLWFAAYLCHFRGVHWSEGAKLFRRHLYDGDTASNDSSWQWVEGTFAAKPYFMNQENVDRFSGGVYCDTCRVKCPFRASYEELQVRLFERGRAPLATVEYKSTGRESLPPPVREVAADPPPRDVLVWVHDAALSPGDAALKANPDAAVVFAFDEPALRAEPWAFHRLAFVFDGVTDLFAAIPNPVKLVTIGDPAADLAEVAAKLGARQIHLTDSANPAVREIAEALRREFAVTMYDRPTLADYAEEPRRFSRYWTKVAPQVLGRSAKAKRGHHK